MHFYAEGFSRILIFAGLFFRSFFTEKEAKDFAVIFFPWNQWKTRYYRKTISFFGSDSAFKLQENIFSSLISAVEKIEITFNRDCSFTQDVDESFQKKKSLEDRQQKIYHVGFRSSFDELQDKKRGYSQSTFQVRNIRLQETDFYENCKNG